MGKASTPTQFKRDFCKRLAAARVMAGLEQAEFAQQLGLLPNTYSKYERRSLLPHYLVARAARILNVDVDFLFTGDPGTRTRRPSSSTTEEAIGEATLTRTGDRA